MSIFLKKLICFNILLGLEACTGEEKNTRLAYQPERLHPNQGAASGSLAYNAPSEFSGEIPSFYGYSTGPNSYLRDLLTNKLKLCGPTAVTRSGSKSPLDYAYTIYNINLKNLKKGATDYTSDLLSLIACAKQTGSLRIILNFNFYAYDESQNRSEHFQKDLVCRTTKVPLAIDPDCPDISDKDAKPVAGYEPPSVENALKAYRLLLPSLLPPSDKPNAGAATVFEGSGYPVLAGVTLGEENVTWDYQRDSGSIYKRIRGTSTTGSLGGRAYFLDQLYAELKIQYPQRFFKFLQWYSPNSTATFPGSSDEWPVIRADGWVFDQYHLNVTARGKSIFNSEYYKYVNGIKRLGVPVYSIVWSSPLRNPTSATPGISADWWNFRFVETCNDGSKKYTNNFEKCEEQSTGCDDGFTKCDDGGWVKFYGHNAINQEFRVPTVYYPYTPVRTSKKYTDKQMDKIAEPTKCGTDLLKYLEKVTWPHLKKRVGLKIPDSIPSWIPQAPDGC